MRTGTSIINESFHRLKSHLWENNLSQKYAHGEPPFRSELFSTEQMENYGKVLAGTHILGPKVAPDQQLLERLAENESLLLDVHTLISDAVEGKRQITPAGEWLLDNFYLIEEQIRIGRRHLPKGYSKELPKLLNEPSAGLPRVYDIAKEVISHGDGYIDPVSLNRFVSSYETVTVLKLGELWAIPIMLRLALIENLRRVAVRVAAGRIDRDLADSWADKLVDIAEKVPKNLILVMADMARSDPPMSPPFVSEFVRRLQGQSPSLAFPLTWIEQRLNESNQTTLQMIQLGTQQQAADQVSISNSIGSLRFLISQDWRKFVESLSHVELTLRKDPAGAYSLMDFQTRDRYRHVVEKIAKKSPFSEVEIASKCVGLAQEKADLNGNDKLTSHVGYYLTGKGLPGFSRLVKIKNPVNVISRHPLIFYLGSITLLTLFITWNLIRKLQNDSDGWHLWLLGIIILLSVSYLSVAVVNWLSTLLIRPNHLPRLDYSEGIPPESRTLVVIPSMLMSSQHIADLIEALEVRFLANQDKNLHFGLLTDFKDSQQEKSEEDDELITSITKKIKTLNKKYPGENRETFFLFHRPRKWNARDRIWMGYERKRGKLSDLNKLLRGDPENTFSHVIGKREVLKKIKYVITLDTDTQLPRDSAKQMIGAMAHPLNKPHYDTKKQRVTDGYTILQPRVAMSMAGTNRSRYAGLFGSEPGIDPYTRTVSDVYQDLFGEGSFIGKGIYDVDSFEQSLDDRFPENRILSHDLLEGCYARSGLLSDVLLFEEYPASYETDVNRRSRWIRGDWQLIPWSLPRISLKRSSKRTRLSLLSYWKIFDNMRRSLVPVALTLLLFLGWTILSSPLFWTLVVIGIISIPPLVNIFGFIVQKPEEIILQQHLNSAGKLAILQLQQATFILISLPYESYYSLIAICKTVWRLLISKKRLLEWNSANMTRHRDNELSGFFRKLWISPFIAILSAYVIINWFPSTLVVVWIILLLWFVFPAIAWWISKLLIPSRARLNPDQHKFLRVLSRKTWFFFETFAGHDENWLPPDNYQEDPVSVVAHRTSPTNIGLSLLANLSAYDFGYIFMGELLERTSNAFRTLNSLEKFQGHFFNWYDTKSLKPLRPFYISSVDSGNLAADLLILRQGLHFLPDQLISGPRLLEGINDTLQMLTEHSGKSLPADINNFRKYLNETIKEQPDNLPDLRKCLEKLITISGDIVKAGSHAKDKEHNLLAQKLSGHCQGALDELKLLVPWIFLPYSAEISAKNPELNNIPSLREVAGTYAEELKSSEDQVNELQETLRNASGTAKRMIELIRHLEWQSGEFSKMEYGFLYDKSRHLLSIGYNIEERRPDSGYYDLLASEARLSSYVAIVQDQIPQESWFALGRLLTSINGEPVLLSWSGSMFEYLMPLVIMPQYENSLLYQTCKSAVTRQIEYGNQRGVPWGISESGYNRVDAQQNYQYRAFGVPGLGLKRGLSDDLVIAPYATALALMIKPEDACENLERMASEGFMGIYGFFEAIDYTPSRIPGGQSNSIVKSFMAHHQGMSLLSLAYILLDRPMQRRFESDPLFQSALLLLQERIPRATVYFAHTSGIANIRTSVSAGERPQRVFTTPDTPYPEVKLLSNGNGFNVMITNAGGGYTRWKNLALTRWREDVTHDNMGTFCYIRDAESGNFWSATFQPSLKRPEKYEAIFSEGRAEFRRRDNEIDTYSEIAVSPEDDIELRRVRLTNRSRSKKIIDITSYAEVVLAPHDADLAHPAFSNLFVQTEIIPQRQAIICTRRPRSVEEKPQWMYHQMSVHGTEIRNISYETDRMLFIGRGNTLISPDAMTNSMPLSGSSGSVLDPIVAVQFQIILVPEGSATIDIVTGISLTREDALSLIEKYQDNQFANRVFKLAWTHSQVILQQINASESDAQLYGRLASSVIYANSSMRAGPSIIIKNHRGQSGLWGYSISGDLPIVLLQIEDPANINLVRQLVQAHAYWKLKGLAADLVIWNEDNAGYRQLLHDQIIGLITAGVESNVIERPGGIFVRSSEQISNEDRILFQTVARVIISDARGSLENQLKKRRGIADLAAVRFNPTRTYRPVVQDEKILPRTDLIFYNGIGGFTSDGREYVITTFKGIKTPAPWVNVIANSGFGTVVSESGNAYTWAENSHEYRLSPWYNDPVRDSSGEAIYIRDEETGHFWSPVPLTESNSKMYVCRHGFGYSVFEHNEGGIISELWIYVATDASVKFSVLKIRNRTGRPCKLSAVSYVEWVLGDLRHKSAMHINTSVDFGNSVIYAANPYSPEFPGRVAFLQTDDISCSFTCDRTEFIGRNGTLKNPAALSRARLSGKKGVALDPCAAIQVLFDLPSGQDREIVFRLGSGRDMEDANRIVQRFRSPGNAQSALEEVWKQWGHILGSVQIETPNIALNVLANGWLLYQTLACRVWARTGFYQSGGAYGFRDQLQDVMALIHAKPGIFREYLLLFAEHQFTEGDVQHWWHPPLGRGVRTHCSDDYLWLPLATARYVSCTGDTGVLDQIVNYIEGPPVKPEADSYYDLPAKAEEKSTLYEHCKRSITHGLRYGSHGLPLIGTCDWNDGMNMVGNLGRGESVWLGFFLYEVVSKFIEIAKAKNDTQFVEICSEESKALQKNIENAWDGEWYLRAYFDNGQPLGSSQNEECRIDSISQSWSALSGAANPDRQKRALESVNEKLVRHEQALIQLLDPPFDKSDLNPGYIKGYVPGVRENGGQYTHAAIWVAMAFAKLGDNAMTWDLIKLLNPINHAINPDKMSVYKVEPYVIAADVYALPPHTGKGGWTWYTGSAGWMYRLILESFLGLRLEVDKLWIEPCIPSDWDNYKTHYRFRETIYHITVMQLHEDQSGIKIKLDGVDTPDGFIRLVDDHREHFAEVKFCRGKK